MSVLAEAILGGLLGERLAMRPGQSSARRLTSPGSIAFAAKPAAMSLMVIARATH